MPAGGWRPRRYQMGLWKYLQGGGRDAVAVWHRRAGKDEIALHHTCIAAHERRGNYWHMLPEYRHARRAMWDAINPLTGRRRIDDAFPAELRESTNQVEMKITLKCGSTWQLVGSDNFDGLIGSPPVGIVHSEYAVADPRADGYLRPILAQNQGWSLKIYTARGYNHGHRAYEAAKKSAAAFAQLLTADDTGVFAPETLQAELENYESLYGKEDGAAFFRQEYYCDWSSANIGAILARYLERAERAGRVGEVEVNPDAPIVVSSDIGFRDTAAWWYWQPTLKGFRVVGYDEDRGLDADEWAPRIEEMIGRLGAKLERIWLPHDARAKTFQSRHSALERFLSRFGAERVRIVPQTTKSDRINAARVVIDRCEFDRNRCQKGLDGLRAWSYAYDQESRTMSREPLHDWASHPGDAYSYGAVVLREAMPPPEPAKTALERLLTPPTLNELWETQESRTDRV